MFSQILSFEHPKFADSPPEVRVRRQGREAINQLQFGVKSKSKGLLRLQKGLLKPPREFFSQNSPTKRPLLKNKRNTYILKDFALDMSTVFDQNFAPTLEN